jgi:hypothetical protein
MNLSIEAVAIQISPHDKGQSVADTVWHLERNPG